MQSWYVHRITSILSNKLGSEVRIGSVDIKFFSKLVLNDVYLEDERKDTLLTIQQLTADINVFSLNNELIDVSTIDLYNANFHMKKYEGEQFSNIITNSSPPVRAKVSAFLSPLLIILVISIKTVSPALCPQLSFIALKWSRSNTHKQ